MTGFFTKLFGPKKVETATESRILEPALKHADQALLTKMEAEGVDVGDPDQVEAYKRIHEGAQFLSGGRTIVKSDSSAITGEQAQIQGAAEVLRSLGGNLEGGSGKKG